MGLDERTIGNGPIELDDEQRADLNAFKRACEQLIPAENFTYDPRVQLSVPSFFAHGQWWIFGVAPVTYEWILTHAASGRTDVENLPIIGNVESFESMLAFVQNNAPTVPISQQQRPSLPMRSQDAKRFWVLVLELAPSAANN